ncbi:hypothetical protein [Methylocella sp.]
MQDAIGAVVEGRYSSPTPLPLQAALCRVDAEGRPLSDGPAWIFSPGARPTGDFVDAAGRVFRLFELVDPPSPDRLGLTSGYTSTGSLVRRWQVPPNVRRIAWLVGIAAAVIFLFGGAWSILTGLKAGFPRENIVDSAFQGRIVRALEANCLAGQNSFPGVKPTACAFLVDDKGVYVASNRESGTGAFGPKVGMVASLIETCVAPGGVLRAQPESDEAGDKAAQDAVRASCELVFRSMASAGVAPPVVRSAIEATVTKWFGFRAPANAMTALTQFLLITLGIAGLAAALGLGMKGRLAGIWIDERNRVSLARAQVTLWTVVALGGFATIALVNIGLGGAATFPSMPWPVAAALGIAFASPMLSAVILKANPAGVAQSPQSLITSVFGFAPDTTDFSARTSVHEVSNSALEARSDPMKASITDIFFGEQVGDADTVDLSRLQNVVLTVVLVMGYFAMLGAQLAAIGPVSLITGVASLPDPGSSFTSVLLLSHATYLGTKAYNNAPRKNSGSPQA